MPGPTEAKTRATLINPQLERAGWNLSDHTQIAFEVPVAGYDKTPWNGFTDFCLYDTDGSVLAVIEAKKTARDAREGEVVARDPEKAREAREKAEAELAELQVRIAPIENEINQLGRQFWVEKKQVVANKYDLSASRYREIEHEEEFFEKPNMTLERLAGLEQHATAQMASLAKLLGTS